MNMADTNDKQRRPSFVLYFFAAMGVLTLVAVFLFAAIVIGGISLISKHSPVNINASSYVNSKSDERYVAGIKLFGQITQETSQDVLDMLDEAHDDKRVVGIVLDVNGPGGSVVASQEIYDAIAKIRETMPIVAYVREMAASGSYYSCASATKIVANRGSLVGSIGVILQTVETTQLVNWLKLRPITLKTGALKDAGSPLREWTSADKSYLQQLIDDTREQFVTDVRSKRQITNANAAILSDGRVVLGAQALNFGLVDSLGTRDDATALVVTLSGFKGKPQLRYLEKPLDYADAIFSFIGNEKSSSSLKEKILSQVIDEISSSTTPARK